MTTLEHQRVQQARQLERLRELREAQARRARAIAQAEHAAAQAAVLRRQAEVQGHRDAREQLLHSAVHDAEQFARLVPYLSARQDDLDDKLERAEYALIDDEETRDDAEREFDAAHGHWRAQHARHDAALDLLARARREQAQAGERRAEREDAPPARGPGHTGHDDEGAPP
jgi:hypothetical protein